MKLFYKNTGFTLIELLVSLAILSMLILIIYSMFKMVLEGYAYNDTLLYLSKESVQALYGKPGGRGIFQNILEASDVQSLDSNKLRLKINGDSVSYYIIGTELIEDSDSYGVAIAANYADALQCSYYYVKWGNITVENSDTSNVNLIHISLRLKKKNMSLQTVLTGRVRVNEN